MTEAKAAYEKSLALDPSDPWTHLYLGNLCFAQSDHLGAAVEWFMRAATLMPDDATPLWCLAEAYEQQEQFDLADENYRKAVEVDPANKLARRKLRSWREYRGDCESDVTPPSSPAPPATAPPRP